MSENEKPTEATEPQAPKKRDGPLTALKKLTAKKATPPAEPSAEPQTTTTTVETAVVDLVIETPKPRRCGCGRKWSAPAPDRCPECGGDTREE